MDEVGRNISQKGDGNKGGQLSVCAQIMTTQQKTSTKDKHLTLLVLTALNGDPVVCVIVFPGKCETILYETGLDAFAKEKGSVSVDDYFKKNSGKGKYTLVDPLIYYKESRFHA